MTTKINENILRRKAERGAILLAKLNGVKIIDMVGGEVTKISYEGAEYTKVENPVAGDIAIIIDPWGRIESGYFYSVEKISEHFDKDYVHISTIANGYVTDMNYFRKVNAQPSAPCASLADEVQALDVRVTKLEANAELDAKPAEEVIEGTPQVGDKIRITNAWIARGDYENGDVFTVKEVLTKAGAVYVKEHSRAVCRKEFVIIERPSKPELTAGKYVKFAEDGFDITAGKHYEVKADSEGDLHFIDDDGDVRYTRLRFPENYEIVEQPPATPKSALKIGDYVKVIAKNYEYDKGNIVKIIGDKTNSDVVAFDFKVEFINVTGISKYYGQTYGYIDAENIAKI